MLQMKTTHLLDIIKTRKKPETAIFFVILENKKCANDGCIFLTDGNHKASRARFCVSRAPHCKLFLAF